MGAEERARASITGIYEIYGAEEDWKGKAWPKFEYVHVIGKYNLTITFGFEDICFMPAMTALLSLMWELCQYYRIDDYGNVMVNYIHEDGEVQLELREIEAEYLPKRTLHILAKRPKGSA